jgi:hypothetical protein
MNASKTKLTFPIYIKMGIFGEEWLSICEVCRPLKQRLSNAVKAVQNDSIAETFVAQRL